jgi:hypothetical protein
MAYNENSLNGMVKGFCDRRTYIYMSSVTVDLMPCMFTDRH